jgi:TRAP-type C4-dicarboxylate transport system permease small subunit
MTIYKKRKLREPIAGFLLYSDRVTWKLGGIFQHVCNFCLLVMLLLTSVTIIGRLFGYSAYWIWPWTMVFFVWLSFFGFFAIFIRLKDIRIDFVAKRMGKYGLPVTRIISNFTAFALTGVILKTGPLVFATSSGVVDGAILPGGNELFRQALSIPLFLSVFLIFLSSIIDTLKMAFGFPENKPEQN